MTKARRMMQEDIKLIDIVIELLDARIPYSSKNPDIDELAKNKYRLVIFNKADLADPERISLWEKYYIDKGFYVLKMDSRASKGPKSVTNAVKNICKDKIERDRRRGILNRPVRAMIVGIPNVGKSTFINSYAGKACAKVGNKPGVTKGKQWIRINKELELLDTPGILWPKFEDQQVGINLAITGSINDEILLTEELSIKLIDYLKINYCNNLVDRYKISGDMSSLDILIEIAKVRHCEKKGGEPDIEKASAILIDDLRSGRLGRISLEVPQ